MRMKFEDEICFSTRIVQLPSFTYGVYRYNQRLAEKEAILCKAKAKEGKSIRGYEG